MKKYLTLLLFVICFQSSIAQKIEIKDNIAYVNDKAYVKIDKKSNGKFFIHDIRTNEKLLKVKFGFSYDVMRKRNKYIVNLHFYPIKKDLLFRDVAIENETNLLRFLYEERMFLSNKPMTNELLLEEYKRISPRSKCKRILKNDFKYVVEDQFVSIVNKDTILLNEVKYRCVYTAFYTKKAMYDRYGKWDESVVLSDSRHPSLIWNNVKLLDDIDKKFIVVAKGYEGMKTIYASMMILDEKGNDMLAEDAPYKSQLIELFGFYIKNNLDQDEFYEAYWTEFNPERWEQIQNYKEPKISNYRTKSYKTQTNDSKFSTPKPSAIKRQ